MKMFGQDVRIHRRRIRNLREAVFAVGQVSKPELKKKPLNKNIKGFVRIQLPPFKRKQSQISLLFYRGVAKKYLK